MDSDQCMDAWRDSVSPEVLDIADFGLEKAVKPKQVVDVKKLAIDPSIQGLERVLHICKRIIEAKKVNLHQLLGAVRELRTAVSGHSCELPRIVKPLSTVIHMCNNAARIAVLKEMEGMQFTCLQSVRLGSAPATPPLPSKAHAPRRRQRGSILMLPDDEFLEEQFIPWILEGIQGANSDDRTAWQNLLLSYLNILSKQALETMIWPLVKQQSWITEAIQHREFAGRMLVTLCSGGLQTDADASPMIDTAKVLCDDTNPGVRVYACEAAQKLFHQSSLSDSKRAMCQELLHALLRDTASLVRQRAVTAYAESLQFLTDEGLDMAAGDLPSVYFAHIHAEDRLSTSYCKNFGLICFQLKERLSDSQRGSLFAYVKACCSAPPPSSEPPSLSASLLSLSDAFPVPISSPPSPLYWMAYNLPAFVISFQHHLRADIKKQTFDTSLIGKCLSQMLKSEDETVRITLAKCFHEVVRVLGSDIVCSTERIIQAVQLLLRSETTAKHLVATFDDLLQSLEKHSTSNTSRARKSVWAKCKSGFVPSVLLSGLHQGLSEASDWRSMKTLLDAIPCLQFHFPAEDVAAMFTPTLQELLIQPAHAHALLPSLARAFVETLHATRSHAVRLEILDWLVTTFAENDSSRLRIHFITVGEMMTQRFSRAFVKQRLFPTMLKLTEDEVLDVRRAIAGLLPALKRMIVLPKDHQLLRVLNTAASALGKGKHGNSEWTAFVKTVHHTLDAIENPITWDQGSLFDDYEEDLARHEDERALYQAYEAELAGGGPTSSKRSEGQRKVVSEQRYTSARDPRRNSKEVAPQMSSRQASMTGLISPHVPRKSARNTSRPAAAAASKSSEQLPRMLGSPTKRITASRLSPSAISQRQALSSASAPSFQPGAHKSSQQTLDRPRSSESRKASATSPRSRQVSAVRRKSQPHTSSHSRISHETNTSSSVVVSVSASTPTDTPTTPRKQQSARALHSSQGGSRSRRTSLTLASSSPSESATSWKKAHDEKRGAVERRFSNSTISPAMSRQGSSSSIVSHILSQSATPSPLRSQPSPKPRRLQPLASHK
eukprot:m.355634 g.355634  ORF g.355634 m.355634 type:complete len:1061 (-) comp17295_c0_seq1:674-3856(-)